jgi:uncharacterized protein DUF4170
VARSPQANRTTAWKSGASEAMARYWVVGGEYSDTRFEELAPGTTAERYGPFSSYDEAYRVWQARARATVDDALVRFRILEEGSTG